MNPVKVEKSVDLTFEGILSKPKFKICLVICKEMFEFYGSIYPGKSFFTFVQPKVMPFLPCSTHNSGALYQ